MIGMARRADLAAFLSSRRARLRPEDVGLAPGSGPRRVPGLRREELAYLAGISVEYYVRLEQGRRNVSDAVLDAVATALRLTEDERTHLHRLARQPAAPRQPRTQQVRPGTLHLLQALRDCTPAFVFGRRMDILAWNRLACALITDFDALPVQRRNLARLVLLDENVVRLYPDRDFVAKDTVGHLRMDAGRNPDDPQLAALVGELSLKSEEFRRHWSMHTVKSKSHGYKRFDHPIVGALILNFETLHLPDDPEQYLTIYTAVPGSPDEERLRILNSWYDQTTTGIKIRRQLPENGSPSDAST